MKDMKNLNHRDTETQGGLVSYLHVLRAFVVLNIFHHEDTKNTKFCFSLIGSKPPRTHSSSPRKLHRSYPGSIPTYQGAWIPDNRGAISGMTARAELQNKPSAFLISLCPCFSVVNK